MATSKKTIEVCFSEIASLTNNTDTNFTQEDVYIPETVVSFDSVVFDLIAGPAETVKADLDRKQLSVSLGGATYTVINNTNVTAESSENMWTQFTANFTSHFTTNWTGTSMTLDAKVLLDNEVGTNGFNGVTLKCYITYFYDDTASTHIKKVIYPLDAPMSILGTSKPGTATASIEALDTWLPENNVVIRQVTLVVEGNENSASTADMTMSWEIDSLGVYTTAIHEKGLNASAWYRHMELQSFDTSTTHDFYLWASQAKFAGAHAYLVITYEFDISGTTTTMNSLMLKTDMKSPAGTSSTKPQNTSIDFYIEEPTTITLKRSALFLNINQRAPIFQLNFRVNSGSYNELTGTGTTMSGDDSMMLRAETEIGSLARGKNTISFDCYRADTTDMGWGITGYFVINYTSGIAKDGVGSHNHTVLHNLICHDTNVKDEERTISAYSINMPEDDYFINDIGVLHEYVGSGSTPYYGYAIKTERLSTEGDVTWEDLGTFITETDTETGIRKIYTNKNDVFKMWTGDDYRDGLDVETARDYKITRSYAGNCFDTLNIMMTYHSITSTISGTVSGYSGTGIGLQVDIANADNGCKILEATTTSGGAYSVTWFDDEEDLKSDCYEDGSHVGRSDTGTATIDT